MAMLRVVEHAQAAGRAGACAAGAVPALVSLLGSTHAGVQVPLPGVRKPQSADAGHERRATLFVYQTMSERNCLPPCYVRMQGCAASVYNIVLETNAKKGELP